MKKPLSNSVVAKHHTAIYSVHRYFARRPHNVFAHIISHYLSKPSLVMDPFAGGGVSLIEGLTLGHRVIGSEISPLACFVITGQLSHTDPTSIRQAVDSCIQYCEERVGFSYKIGREEVYWYGWESVTSCTHCGKKTHLNPAQSAGSGSYICQSCGAHFKAKLVHKDSVTPSQVCLFSGDPWTETLQTSLRELKPRTLAQRHKKIQNELERLPYRLSKKLKTPIPKCNLEKESALHKKGFLFFEDFVTDKNQAWILCFAEAIEVTSRDDANLKLVLFYILSASIRYISRFSSLNESWRKGHKPLEWAKSNFWSPYAFVELNPKVALIARVNAYLKGMADYSKRFPTPPKLGTAASVLNGKADFAIVNQPSQTLSYLSDNVVDLILTDPPYGSYLNYGELSGFWLSWLRHLYAPMKFKQIIYGEEAICSRKVHKDNYKTFEDYQSDLAAVFKECYRVLKPGHYMVFTFNNKEPEAWLALLRSVKLAGFRLPDNGVLFQDGVEAYKRSIALRRSGAIHGDFIYSFFKPLEHHAPVAPSRNFSWRDAVQVILARIFKSSESIRNSDLYLKLNQNLLPTLYGHLGGSTSEDTTNLEDFNFKNLESLLKENLIFSNGLWTSRKLPPLG